MKPKDFGINTKRPFIFYNKYKSMARLIHQAPDVLDGANVFCVTCINKL